MNLRGGITEIKDVLIKDNCTGKGAGTELLKYIEKWAKEKYCRKVILKVPSVYKKSVKFYKNNGFKIDATLPKYYYGCDWYYMSKGL